jgi:hypothetical protein
MHPPAGEKDQYQSNVDERHLEFTIYWTRPEKKKTGSEELRRGRVFLTAKKDKALYK